MAKTKNKQISQNIFWQQKKKKKKNEEKNKHKQQEKGKNCLVDNK